jgi:sec-independent protein translocase protein TatA
MSIGAPELLIILVIILLIFGSTQVPKLARSLGRARKEFAEGAKDREASSSDDTSGPE